MQRRLHHLHDLLGHPQHVVGLDDVSQDYGELVTGIARHRIRGTDAAAQALGDHAQHLVARRMPVGIVDRLESIQIDEQHREALAGAMRFANDGVEAIVEKQPIGQPGKRIEQALGTPLLARAAQFDRLGEARRRAAQHRLDDLEPAKATAASHQQRTQHAAPLVEQRQAGKSGHAELLQQADRIRPAAGRRRHASCSCRPARAAASLARGAPASPSPRRASAAATGWAANCLPDGPTTGPDSPATARRSAGAPLPRAHPRPPAPGRCATTRPAPNPPGYRRGHCERPAPPHPCRDGGRGARWPGRYRAPCRVRR